MFIRKYLKFRIFFSILQLFDDFFLGYDFCESETEPISAVDVAGTNGENEDRPVLSEEDQNEVESSEEDQNEVESSEEVESGEEDQNEVEEDGNSLESSEDKILVELSEVASLTFVQESVWDGPLVEEIEEDGVDKKKRKRDENTGDEPHRKRHRGWTFAHFGCFYLSYSSVLILIFGLV